MSAPAEKKAIVAALHDLIEGHYSEAEASMNDAGKFAISFNASVVRGNPIKVKVSCRISRGAITDEVEQEVSEQPELPLE